MVAIFAIASFLGSALLFLIEPMLVKLVLPYFGGSPMVWNTATLVFQLLLLAGYVYTHLATRRLGPRRQPWVHLALVLPVLLLLPVALPGDPAPPAGTEPTLWLLRVLLVAIGLPFAVLATTGPLLQRWFSWTGHRRADDPYFLYAASNAGSVVGLLGYPFVIEPSVGLAEQTRWWSVAYVVFALLIATCGVVTLLASRKSARVLATAAARSGSAQPGATAKPREPRAAARRERSSGTGRPGEAAEPTGVRRRLSWIALAFLPSSLMLGVSTHVSTDIAAMPLFWTVPLAVYLATFVVAFARSSRRAPRLLAGLALVAAVPALLNAIGAWTPTVAVSVTVHLVALAAAALAAHARLAATRPPTEELTSFYLLIAIGGALGGLLNGFIAPVVLDRPLEYPVVLSLVPLLMVFGSDDVFPMPGRSLVRRSLAAAPTAVSAVALLWVASVLSYGSTVLDRDRTFYGSYRVTGSDERRFLYHGTTLHGWEVLRGPGAGEPTSYYTRSSPIGDVMAAERSDPSFRRIAVVGMGVGTLAAYGQPRQRMDFYEIDPAVVRIAQGRHFAFLARSKADVGVIVGDGRLKLSEATSSYGLIVLDAFSSDAIPVHLLTVEAIREYRRKLAPGGLLAIHISNRHVRLAPMIAAQAPIVAMTAVHRNDAFPEKLGTVSHWVVLGRDDEDVARLLDLRGWTKAQPERGVQAWTDDYSSLVEILKLD